MKYKILTRVNQNPPHQIQYQLRWYTLGGLIWDVVRVPTSHHPDVMRYPANFEDVEEWVDDESLIWAFLPLMIEYERKDRPLPKKWKVVDKVTVFPEDFEEGK